MSTILIVEDDVNINEMLKVALQKEGYSCIQAFSGTEGRLVLSQEEPDLVLLDLMLPGMSGETLLEEIRQTKRAVPVIVLSARDEMDSKVDMLLSGADDYVVKPFDLVVLYSRILALLRRTEGVTHTKLFCDELMLDKEKTAVYNGQKEIVVSQSEYRILLILMENKGKTITRNQLLEQVWDRSGNYVNDNTLTVTMKRLREKLNHPACLKTIRSFGYRMEDTL